MYIDVYQLTGSLVELFNLELLDFHIYFLGGGNSVISLLPFGILKHVS